MSAPFSIAVQRNSQSRRTTLWDRVWSTRRERVKIDLAA
jgi:hypothetical protein